MPVAQSVMVRLEDHPFYRLFGWCILGCFVGDSGDIFAGKSTWFELFLALGVSLGMVGVARVAYEYTRWKEGI